MDISYPDDPYRTLCTVSWDDDSKVYRAGCKIPSSMTSTYCNATISLDGVPFRSHQLHVRCKAGWFEGENSGVCVECPDGADCSKQGTVLETLPIKKGYWRSEANSADVVQCNLPEACSGSGSKPTNLTDYCNEGYRGILCESCKQAYFLLVDRCETCVGRGGRGGQGNSGTWIWLAAFTAVISGLLFLWFRLLRHHHGAIYIWAEYMWSSFGTQARTVWSGLQILSNLPSLLFDFLPDNVKKVYNSMILANVDPSMVFPPACYDSFFGTYYARLMSTTIPPVVAACAIGLSYKICSRRTRVASEERLKCYNSHLHLFLLLCYFTLPSISSAVFQAFDCDNPWADVSVLRADYVTDCNEDSYRYIILPWAVVSVVVFPVGINVLYFILLFQNRDESGKQKHDSAISILHRGYAAHAWCWEPIDTLRRISLTGTLVWFPGQGSRLLALALFSFGWLVIYNRVEPFVRLDDQLLAEIINAELVFTAIVLTFSQGELVDKRAIGIICLVANFVVVPIICWFQLRHIWRGWRVVQSLNLGVPINDSFQEEWFMRYWEAGGTARSFLRNKTIKWLQSALQSPETTCDSILHLLRLPPFQDIDVFDGQGMGIVVQLSEQGGPSFATLTREATPFQFHSNPMNEDDGQEGSRSRDGSNPMHDDDLELPQMQVGRTRTINAQHVLSSCEFGDGKVEPTTTIRVERTDSKVAIELSENEIGRFELKLNEGGVKTFETVLMYTLQQLLAQGQGQSFRKHKVRTQRVFGNTGEAWFTSRLERTVRLGTRQVFRSILSCGAS